MEQLSSFFSTTQYGHSQYTGDTFGNNPPSADNVTPDADMMLSAAPDLVASLY